MMKLSLPLLAAFLLLSFPAHADICQFVRDSANSGKLEDRIITEAVNVPVGSRKLNLRSGESGAAQVPYLEAEDAVTHKPVDAATLYNTQDLWNGDHLGFVKYEGKNYVLHYKDPRHPVLVTLLGSGHICQFSNSFVETPAPTALEPALCQNLASGVQNGTINFYADSYAYLASNAYDWLSASNQLLGVATIDLANNTKSLNVAQIYMTSTAGPGCELLFYDLIGEDGLPVRTNERRQLLALQNVDVTDDYPIRIRRNGPVTCTNAPRFFREEDATYFENKPRVWPPQDDAHTYHRVTRLRAGKVEDVCNFTFRTSVQ